jgi:septum formation protein
MARMILASTSPYRRELLGRLGIAFETVAPGVDEAPHPNEGAQGLAQRLAREKAEQTAQRTGLPGDVFIAADQSAGLGDTILGKPGNYTAALSQLEACQGRNVIFYTATEVIQVDSESRWHHLDTTTVQFRRRDRAQLGRYLEQERPYDCAGGFKAEGLGIALFESIESRDPTALLGLPLIWLTQVFLELDLDPLAAIRT